MQIRNDHSVSAEAEQYLRSVLNALPAAIYTTDVSGRLTFYNQAAARLWGRYPRLGEEYWCGSWRILRLDGTVLPHEECPMAVALKENRPVRGVMAIAERPNGTRFPFLPFPTPLHDENGNLTGAVNMLVDISDYEGRETLQNEMDLATSAIAAVIKKNS